MKKVLLILLIGSFFALPVYFSSCEDMMGGYLAKSTGVNDISEDTIFSSLRNVEAFLYSTYQVGIHSVLGYSALVSENNNDKSAYANPNETLLSGSTDESETLAAWYNETQSWNDGTVNANQFGDKRVDRRFYYRFLAIRQVTIMLDRIDGVKDPALTPEYKEQIKAEVKVIRAMNYLEMLKRYGGVPIIDHRLSLDDDLKIPRASFEETVNFILRDCNEALPALPLHQLGNLRGRIHQGVALAIISRTLLYAASKLYNTETPYLSFADPANNKLVCYGNYDRNRWVAAADAAAAVIFDWAPAAKCVLTTGNVDMNYRNTWDVYDNMEIILAEKSRNTCGRYTWPWSAFCPVAPGNAGQSGISPLMNFIRKYETRQGTVQNWDLNIDPTTGKGVPNYGLQEIFANLDRRFKWTILYNMAQWNAQFPEVPLYQESNFGSVYPNLSGTISTCKGGFWLHKLYPYRIDNVNWSLVPNSTIFMLNEYYLNYAEAMFEAYGPEARDKYSLSAREAVNIIRVRSGQPEIPAGQLTMERIRNERAIELAFDDHRFWDIRRWMIAEEDGVMQGNMIGIEIHAIPDAPKLSIDQGFYYIPKLVEKRTFLRRMYMHPFPTDEVNKGYLIQNPGY